MSWFLCYSEKSPLYIKIENDHFKMFMVFKICGFLICVELILRGWYDGRWIAFEKFGGNYKIHSLKDSGKPSVPFYKSINSWVHLVFSKLKYNLFMVKFTLLVYSSRNIYNLVINTLSKYRRILSLLKIHYWLGFCSQNPPTSLGPRKPLICFLFL